jgi:hypothetical protein
MQLVTPNPMAPTVPKSVIALFFTFKIYLNKLLFLNLKKIIYVDTLKKIN